MHENDLPIYSSNRTPRQKRGHCEWCNVIQGYRVKSRENGNVYAFHMGCPYHDGFSKQGAPTTMEELQSRLVHQGFEILGETHEP